MLRLISITNFATIEHLDLELAPGFNVLTGETGAGKSIIVDALSLLLGGRADAGMVRAGAQQSRVEGVFLLGAGLREHIAHDLGDDLLEDVEGEVILAREVNLEGRNTCRVNGRIVPLKTLATIADSLVDVHGQGEHLSLLRVRQHLHILDRYAGLDDLRQELARRVDRLREIRRELAHLRRDERERAQRADLLRYQVDEIARANLRPGEEEELVRQHTIASNAERLTLLSDEAYRMLWGEGGGGASVSDMLGQVVHRLAELERLDPSLKSYREAADGLLTTAEDLAAMLRSYRDSIEYSPEHLRQIEERLDLMDRLKRKYGDTVEEVIAFAQRAAAELEDISHGEERAQDLSREEEALLEEAGALARRLSEARREAAARLTAAVEEHLGELALERTRMGVDIQQAEADDGLPVPDPHGGPLRRLAFDATGIDRIEFLVSPNPGEPLRPLARIASGGEASRLMLAIKAVLSAADPVPTLVFDEIDAGIGGRVGAVVGRKLWSLARSHQVLCVTHLPQIACYADHHVRVAKATKGDRTVTSVEPIEGSSRVEELRQMLGAAGRASQQTAQDLLEEARRWKEGCGREKQG